MNLRDLDLVSLHRSSIATLGGIVSQIEPGQLDAPTPCGPWAVRELMAHVVGQNHGFAAAAEGERSDLSVFDDRSVGDDPAGAFQESADRLLVAFAADGLLERELWLPVLRIDGLLAARVGVWAQFIDSVVHAWDVAKAIGVPVLFEAEVLEVALATSRGIPDDESREQPGAAFAHAVPAPAGASRLDELVAMLGRSPSWPS